MNDDDAQAWLEGTARAWAIWKRAILQAEADLVRFGCAFALLDVLTALSACFAPVLAPLLGVARLAGLAILAPAALRALAIRHASRPDAELLKAIAVAIAVVALYVAVRTSFVVRVCAS